MNCANFLHADCEAEIDRHHTLYRELLNAILRQLYLLDPMERSYEIWSHPPSILLSVRLYSWNYIIRFF